MNTIRRTDMTALPILPTVKTGCWYVEGHTYSLYKPLLPNIAAEAAFRWNVDEKIGCSRGHKKLGMDWDNSLWVTMVFGYLMEPDDHKLLGMYERKTFHPFELHVSPLDHTIRLVAIDFRSRWGARWIPLIIESGDDWNDFQTITERLTIVSSTKTARK